MILKCILIRSLYYIFWVWERFYFSVRFGEQFIVSRTIPYEALITLLFSSPACFPWNTPVMHCPLSIPSPRPVLHMQWACVGRTHRLVTWFLNCHLQVLSSACWLLRTQITSAAIWLFFLVRLELIYLDSLGTTCWGPCMWWLAPPYRQSHGETYLEWLISLSPAQMSTCWKRLSHSYATLCNNWQVTLTDYRPLSLHTTSKGISGTYAVGLHLGHIL